MGSKNNETPDGLIRPAFLFTAGDPSSFQPILTPKIPRRLKRGKGVT